MVQIVNVVPGVLLVLEHGVIPLILLALIRIRMLLFLRNILAVDVYVFFPDQEIL